MPKDWPKEAKSDHVFIGLKDVANRYNSLHIGMRRIGVNADFYSTFWKGGPEKLDNGNKYFYQAQRSHKNLLEADKLLYKFTMWALQRFWSTFALFSVALKYKVFLFSFCTTFLPWGLDIIILRAMGRRVVVYAGHGSDTRPKFFQGPPEKSDSVFAASEFILKEKARAIRIGFMTKFSSLTISVLPVDHYIKGEYVESFWLGVPSVLEDIGTQDRQDLESRRITYSHQPSKASIKGTREILADMKSLGVERMEPELREKLGVQEWIPRYEVLQIMQNSDFYYDQNYLDIPTSVSGVEAGSLGKPVVYKGAGPSVYRNEYPEMKLPPLLNADDELPNILASPDSSLKLRTSGQELKVFLQLHWGLESVSQRYLDVLFGNGIKAHWLRKPSRQFCLPIGLSDEEFEMRKDWLNKSPLIRLFFPKIWRLMQDKKS